MHKDRVPLAGTQVFFTEEQLEYLRKRFVQAPLRPGMTMDQIMYIGGQQSVLDAVAQLTRKPQDVQGGLRRAGIT